MLPTVRILDPANGMMKYDYGDAVDALTVESIDKFITDFQAGNLTPFLKSEPIPET